MNRTITIVVNDEGGAQWFFGGEIDLQMAANVCRGVTAALERASIEAEVRRELEGEPSPPGPLSRPKAGLERGKEKD